MQIINYDILLRLLVAHLIGDFILQPKDWVEKRNENVLKSFHIYVHCIIHGILAYVLLFNFSSFAIPVIITISHFFIDFIKIRFIKEKKFSFIFDQVLHISVIIIIWVVASNQCNQIYNNISLNLINVHIWMILLAYLLVLKPTSLLIFEFTKKWESEIKVESLVDAGRWIGYLERILILTFILKGYYQAIGFLLAAKSIFRFGDLKGDNNIKLTEYVLIGTLASFVIAIIAGVILKKFLLF